MMCSQLFVDCCALFVIGGLSCVDDKCVLFVCVVYSLSCVVCGWFSVALNQFRVLLVCVLNDKCCLQWVEIECNVCIVVCCVLMVVFCLSI